MDLLHPVKIISHGSGTSDDKKQGQPGYVRRVDLAGLVMEDKLKNKVCCREHDASKREGAGG